ncbi:MAG: hypothetical protein LUD72_01435 [Bacteroidales bacterium]|nr:hypothetical protein [Bacteroidales bacterium]
MSDNMTKFLAAAKDNEEIKKGIDEIEAKFQDDLQEELNAMKEHGVAPMEKDDLINGNKRALEAFRSRVSEDQKLDVYTAKFEDKLRKRADKYIELAAKYGITLEPADFLG